MASLVTEVSPWRRIRTKNLLIVLQNFVTLWADIQHVVSSLFEKVPNERLRIYDEIQNLSQQLMALHSSHLVQGQDAAFAMQSIEAGTSSFRRGRSVASWACQPVQRRQSEPPQAGTTPVNNAILPVGDRAAELHGRWNVCREKQNTSRREQVDKQLEDDERERTEGVETEAAAAEEGPVGAEKEMGTEETETAAAGAATEAREEAEAQGGTRAESRPEEASEARAGALAEAGSRAGPGAPAEEAEAGEEAAGGDAETGATGEAEARAEAGARREAESVDEEQMQVQNARGRRSRSLEHWGQDTTLVPEEGAAGSDAETINVLMRPQATSDSPVLRKGRNTGKSSSVSRTTGNGTKRKTSPQRTEPRTGKRIKASQSNNVSSLPPMELKPVPKNIIQPKEVYYMIADCLGDAGQNVLQSLTRLFFAVASPDSFCRLRYACLSVRKTEGLALPQLESNITQSMQALDSLEATEQAAAILRRYYLVRLVQYRNARQQNHRDQTAEPTARMLKYGHEKPRAKGKTEGTRRAATLALNDLLQEACPELEAVSTNPRITGRPAAGGRKSLVGA